MKKLHAKEALEYFFNQVMVEQPLLPFLIPLGLFAWFLERWVVQRRFLHDASIPAPAASTCASPAGQCRLLLPVFDHWVRPL
jgi:hypothetical protein